MEDIKIKTYTNDQYIDLRSKIIALVEHELPTKSIIERKAYAEAAFFLMNKVCINKSDILAGKLEVCNLPTMWPESMEQEIRYIEELDYQQGQDFKSMLIAEKIGLFTSSPGEHMVPAYDVLIHEGIQNRICRVKEYLVKCSETEKKQFYTAEIIVLCAMQERILMYAKEAEKLYKTFRNNNIKRIQKSCERIAYYPPRTFHEAVQLVILAHEHIIAEGGSGSISFGRVDQYFFPFYKNDVCSGVITEEEAQKIITAFWRKIAKYEKGWQNVTLGGCNKNGEDMCNDLTVFCMNASLEVRADQPQISLRVHKNMPQSIWHKAFELIKTGMGWPALFNDEIAVKAKMSAGISEEDAWNYSIIGCVELSAGGKEYSHTEAARVNWQKILELMLNEGRCAITGQHWELSEKYELDKITDFQEFYEWYKRELVHFTEFICFFTDALCHQYTVYWSVPFLSSMAQGCIENGKDITNCGTIYNNLTLNCVGIASVADSLEAIERLVFKEKVVSLKELSDILRGNFEGNESLRRRMLECPKYGNDIISVDQKVKELTELFVDILSNQKMKYREGKFQAGFYTSYFHASLGELTGASPDGRYAGEALSSSLSPMAGMDINGPTAVINSANHIDMGRFGNGMVLDLKFTSDFFEQEKHRQAIQMLIEEYFERGGMEIQFNTLNRETLIAAQKNPFKYRNLVVRVSGFSAYFVSLDESLQNEIIRRTEHRI